MKSVRRINLFYTIGLLILVSLCLSAYNFSEQATETPTPENTPSPTVEITNTSTITPTLLAATATRIPTSTFRTRTPTPRATFTPSLTPVSRIETSISQARYHKWSLVYWSTNGTACDIYLFPQENFPTYEDVFKQCSPMLY
jgi:hypothetical protein